MGRCRGQAQAGSGRIRTALGPQPGLVITKILSGTVLHTSCNLTLSLHKMQPHQIKCSPFTPVLQRLASVALVPQAMARSTVLRSTSP